MTQDPGMDGFSVCQQLKQDDITKHIRVIAMTGYYTPDNETKILEAGAEACLAKPFDKNVLLSVMGLEQVVEEETMAVAGGLGVKL